MNQGEKDFILATIYIKEMPPNFYTYTNEDGVKVAYYIPDMKQLLEKKVFEPVYYFKENIARLQLSQVSLYHKIMHNTSIILPAKIMEFSEYLEEKGSLANDKLEEILVNKLSIHLKDLPEPEKLWCLTNSRRFNGAIGFYQLPIVNDFCASHNYPKLLIGVGNRDFAYIMAESEKNLARMYYMIEKCPDIVENGGTLEQPYLFTYDNVANKLTRIF